MLNEHRTNITIKKNEFAERDIKITRLFYFNFLKKQKTNRILIYNGDTMNEKKLCIFDINNLTGNYVLTRKLYAKPEKYFKFKY